ncbi:hypothetical protein BSKO_03713 [Bryopsis sp. KO-2023]|nr:hypothetical protein BSKO_03713 [Bryopsis sp. KO-2023]
MASQEKAAVEVDTLEENDVCFDDVPTQLFPAVQLLEPHLPRIDSFLAEITGVESPTELSLLVAETLTRKNPPKLSSAPRVYYGKSLRKKIADKIIKPAIAFLRLGPQATPSNQTRSRSPSRSRCITTASEASFGSPSLDAMKPKTMRYVDIVRTISYNRVIKALPEGQRYGQFYRSRSLNPNLDLDTRCKSFSVAQAMSYIEEEDKEQVVQRAISYRPPPSNEVVGTDQAFVEEEDALDFEEAYEGFSTQDSKSFEVAAAPRVHPEDEDPQKLDEGQARHAPDAEADSAEDGPSSPLFQEALFTPDEIESINAFFGNPPVSREPSDTQILANTLGRLSYFRSIPWQARLALCRHAKCAKFEENQEVVLGPIEEIEEQLRGKELVVVLSGFGCIEERGDVAVSHNKLKLLRPSSDFLLSAFRNTDGGNGSTSKIARIDKPSTWLVVSKEEHTQSLQLDAPGSALRAERILKESKLFTASLSSDEIQALSQLCRVEEYPKETRLLRSWEPAPCIYLVESGECMVQSGIVGLDEGRTEPSESTNEITGRNTSLQLMNLRRGECFGEATAIKGQRLWASLKTKSACKSIWNVVQLISVTINDFKNALAKATPAKITAAFEMIMESSKSLLIKAISLQLKMVTQRELDPKDLTKRMQQIISDATTKGMTQKELVPGLKQAKDVYVPTQSSCEQLSECKKPAKEKVEAFHLDGSKVSAARLDAVSQIGRLGCLASLQMSEAFKIPAEEVEVMRSTEGYGSEAPSASAIEVVLHTKESPEENSTAQEKGQHSQPIHDSSSQCIDTFSEPKAQTGALPQGKRKAPMAVGGFLDPGEDTHGFEDPECLVHGRHAWVRHQYHIPAVHSQEQQNQQPAASREDDEQDVWYVTFKPPKGKSTAGNAVQTKEPKEEKTEEESNNSTKREMGSTLRHVPHSFRPVERQPIFPQEQKLPNEQWTVPKFNSEEGFPDGLYDENNHILYFG